MSLAAGVARGIEMRMKHLITHKIHSVIRCMAAACVALAMLAQDSAAQTRERIGYGRLITNDYLANGTDRWRSGSIASSRVWGRGWADMLPQQPGEILELRFGAEIISPEDLLRRAPGDRLYATALSAGLHTQFERNGTEFALGADLVIIGPQTRLDRLQGAFHDMVGVSKASAETRAEQVGNAVHPTLVGEAGREVALGTMTRIRPFLEARAGVETLVRAGVDVTIGEMGRGELLIRDPVTGHRYRTMPQGNRGFSFVFGADIASVDSSAYFPASSEARMRDARTRLRGGLHWQGGPAALFYGLTWLGKEFEAQDEGQFVGSVRVDLNF